LREREREREREIENVKLVRISITSGSPQLASVLIIISIIRINRHIHFKLIIQKRLTSSPENFIIVDLMKITS
jgi:hypothetical protein